MRDDVASPRPVFRAHLGLGDVDPVAVMRDLPAIRSPRAARARGWPLALAFVLLSLLLPRFAEASRPVIAPDREADVLSLLDPHSLGDELAPGWMLHSVAIDRSTIHLWIAGPESRYAHLTLDHLDYGPWRARSTESFALVVVEQPLGSEAAVAALSAAIERNDDGHFWRVTAPDVERRSEGVRAFGELAPLRVANTIRVWATDGLVLLTLFTLVLLGLVAHELRGAEPWMKVTLLAIVLWGAALRLVLSPEVALAPWPYTRFLLSSRLIYEGPALTLLHPASVWMTDATLTSNLAFALLAPLAVYVHARYLLDDHRAALIVAGIFAVLPLHLRFSHSDVAFIPSITVSSMVFTLVHMATRERSRVLGWSAVAVIGFPLTLVYLVRPLNIMYFALLIATVFVHHGLRGEKPRVDRARAVVTGLVLMLVTFMGGVPWLLESFGEQVRAGLGVDTLTSAVEVLVDPRKNALLDPRFTPPGLTALAVLGAVDLWRRGKRPLFWFLVSWLLGFLIAHAYVVPSSPYMQARYHLHLVVPFVLLAACGVDATLRWLAARREHSPWLSGHRHRAAIVALAAYVFASPLIHLSAIAHTELNDAREWLFVHALRDEIPAGCSIVEYTGVHSGARFGRVGAHIEHGIPRARWPVHEIEAPSPGEPEIPAEILALLMDPPECLYWYAGLPCVGNAPSGRSKSPACEAFEALVTLEEVATTSFESVPYDENLAVGLAPGAPVELSLYRVRPRQRRLRAPAETVDGRGE